MKNLTSAIFAKAAGTPFLASLGGRLYKRRVPQGTAYPHAYFFVVSDSPMDTFKDSIEDVTIQFSIFSKESSSSEIEDLFSALKDVYDNAVLSIAGNTQVMSRRTGAYPESIEQETPDAIGEVWQYDVEYSVIMQKN